MLPTEIVVALIGAPGALLAIFLNWRNSRASSVVVQAQNDAARIRDLFARLDTLDARNSAISDKLQEAREAQLDCEAAKNEALSEKVDALAGKADAVAQTARCAQLHKDYEDERQRVTLLAMNLQRELDAVRKAKVIGTDYNDQTG